MHVPLADLTRLHGALREKFDEAIAGILDKNDFITGAEVQEFEEEFAAFSGVNHAIGVASGTDALIVALAALGVGAGDEAITVPNTFAATSEAITAVGARVRFVDVDPRTYTLDPRKLERAITPKTRAVIPVHLYGQPCDMDAIMDIARKHSLLVIEDAAHANGARWNGQPVGSFGDCACFSFSPEMNLGAIGEAGAIVTKNEELAAQMRQLRDHGRVPGTEHEHAVEGLNARMDALQAAVLLVKLPHLTEWNATRLYTATRYEELLASCNEIIVPEVHDRAKHVFHRYVVQTPRRAELRKSMNERGIATGIHYPIPLHRQPAYAHLGLPDGSFPVVERLASRIVSLPMFAYMTEPEISHVTKAVRTFFGSRVHA